MDQRTGHCDLSDYAERIRDDDDKPLFAEACLAAEAGAFRAAYIVIWLACAESIKRRFRELAQQDHEAGRIVGEINRKEQQHHSVDRYLLESAANYGFLKASEKGRLEYIYDRRCVFGHPYEEAPDAEELRAAAAAVVELILSRPIKLRHGYISRQVELLTGNKNFLDDVEEAVEAYARQVAARVDNELHFYFFKKACEAIEPQMMDPMMRLFGNRVVWFLKSYIRDLNPEAIGDWDTVDVLTEHPVVAACVMVDPSIFSVITEHAQDMVVGTLLDNTDVAPGTLIHLQHLDDCGELTDRHRERLNETIGQVTFSVLKSSGLHLRYWVTKAIEAMKSQNWYRQNPAIGAIRQSGPCEMGEITPPVQEELGRNLLQCADGTAHEAVVFMEEFALAESRWPEDCVKGIVFECFINEEDEIRFKTLYASEALLGIRTLPQDRRNSIIEELNAAVTDGTVRETFHFDDDRQDMLEILEQVITVDDMPNSELLALKSLIEDLGEPEEADDNEDPFGDLV